MDAQVLMKKKKSLFQIITLQEKWHPYLIKVLQLSLISVHYLIKQF